MTNNNLKFKNMRNYKTEIITILILLFFSLLDWNLFAQSNITELAEPATSTIEGLYSLLTSAAAKTLYTIILIFSFIIALVKRSMKWVSVIAFITLAIYAKKIVEYLFNISGV